MFIIVWGVRLGPWSGRPTFSCGFHTLCLITFHARPGLQGPPLSWFFCTPSSFWPSLLQSLVLLIPGLPVHKTSLVVVRQQEASGARHQKAGGRLDLN